MSEEMQEYLKDSRRICKYGLKCYQKNPEHHRQFKHPPPSKAKADKKGIKNRFEPYRKTKNIQNEATVSEQDDQKVTLDTIVSKTSNEKDEVNILEGNAKDGVNIEDKGNLENKNKEGNGKEDKDDKERSTLVKESKDITECLIQSDNISFYDKDTDKSIIKECFLVEMPEDFYSFYEFLSESESAEKLLSGVNLQLIGPYELFLGKLPKLEDKDKHLYLVHWRFFYDVPEFQAVLKKKGKSEFHIGYFRDDPKDKPAFLGKNNSSVDCTITPISDNIFGAVYWYLQNEKKTSPFTAVACQKLMDKVKKYAEGKEYSLGEFNTKKRLQQTVCRTFHHAGIVVPYDKKTQLGYRTLAESDKNLKKMFHTLKEAKSKEEKDKILSELQPILTFASIAMDECDFGTGLEAGVALFCSGIKELETCALQNLEVAYSLLKRQEFGKIIQVHMKNRRKGPNMSILSGSN